MGDVVRRVFLLLLQCTLAFSFEAVSNPWLTDSRKNATHRKHNWCDEANGLESRGSWNVTKSLGRSLHGKTVSIVMMKSAVDDLFFRYDEDSGQLLGGYLVEIIEEVSRRCGFLWQHSFAVVDPPGPEGYDKWLAWATSNYDVVVGAFAMTPNRRAMGFRFGFPMQSNNPVLVTRQVLIEPSTVDTFFSWLRPFNSNVWFTTLFAILLTSAIYQFIEAGQKDFETQNFGDGSFYIKGESGYEKLVEYILHALYLVFGQLIKNSRPSPVTKFGKALVIFWAFTCLLLSSAYMANLASLLVSKSTPEVSIQSVHDAIRRHIPVCVYKGGAFDGVVQDVYPQLPVKFPKHFGYESLRDGSCAALVKDYSIWQVDKGSSKINGRCDLVVAGEQLSEMNSGFVAKDDEALQCDGFVIDVIGYAMSDMYADGWFKRAHKAFLTASQNHTCERSVKHRHGGSALTIFDAGGVFAFYVFSVGCCVVGHFSLRVSQGKVTIPAGSLAVRALSPRG